MSYPAFWNMLMEQSKICVKILYLTSIVTFLLLRVSGRLEQLHGKRIRRSIGNCGTYLLDYYNSNTGDVAVDLSTLSYGAILSPTYYEVIQILYKPNPTSIQIYSTQPNDFQCGSGTYGSGDIRGYLCIETSQGLIKRTSTFQAPLGSRYELKVQITSANSRSATESTECWVYVDINIPVFVTSTPQFLAYTSTIQTSVLSVTGITEITSSEVISSSTFYSLSPSESAQEQSSLSKATSSLLLSLSESIDASAPFDTSNIKISTVALRHTTVPPVSISAYILASSAYSNSILETLIIPFSDTAISDTSISLVNNIPTASVTQDAFPSSPETTISRVSIDSISTVGSKSSWKEVYTAKSSLNASQLSNRVNGVPNSSSVVSVTPAPTPFYLDVSNGSTSLLNLTLVNPTRSFGNASCSSFPMSSSTIKGNVVYFNSAMLSDNGRAKEIQRLAEAHVVSSNASMVSEDLANLTSRNSSSLNSAELKAIVQVLENLQEVPVYDMKIIEKMLDSIDNFLKAHEDAVITSQRWYNTSSRILRILGELGEMLSLITNGDFITVKSEFALAATRENKTTFQGITIRYTESTNFQVKLNEIYELFIKGKNAIPMSGSLVASVSLHSKLVNKLKALGMGFSTVFVVHNTGKLFRGSNTNMLNSNVISAEIRNNKLTGLSNPVVITFRKLNWTDANPSCTWWDFAKSGGLGGWSTEGCELFENKGNVTVCHCNHLTNFALVFGTKPTTSKETHQMVLSMITIIGCGISSAGAIITLVSYIIFRRLRESLPPKILMHLCLAYIMMFTSFLLGSTRTETKLGCQISSALIQYFLLCVFSWSLVEGYTSFHCLARPMASPIRKPMTKAVIFGWGMPVIFVAVGLAMWSDQYGDNQSCIVKGMPFYTTVLPLVGLTIFTNISFLLSIICALNHSSQTYKHHAMNRLDRLRIITAFVLLFGLTWTFGLLVVSNDIVVFQYIFCIVASLQGFFVFLFYCVRNENVRLFWGQKIRVGRRSSRVHTASTTRSSAKSKQTDSMYIDNPYAVSKAVKYRPENDAQTSQTEF